MHGRLKVKTTAEQEEEKRKERQAKANQFRLGTEKLFVKRKNGDYDDEALIMTSQILCANPDFYTIWNYRKEIVLKRQNDLVKNLQDKKVGDESNSGDDKQDELAIENLFENELQLTANCLMKNPKSYNSWHHRLWTIENHKNPNLNREIMLCNRFLEMDERNFHCWDYRRSICALAKVKVNEELEFTLEKVKQNFSNFSSWYYRICLITQAVLNENYKFSQHWKDEYDLVENALFTDPSDQSPWFYHKWLVSTDYGNKVILNNSKVEHGISIERVIFNSNNSMLALEFSRPIKTGPKLSVIINNVCHEIEWNSIDSVISSIWYCFVDYKSLTSLSLEGINLTHSSQDQNEIIVWERNNDNLKANQIELDDVYLKQLKLLHELEPENKWVNLTLSWLDSDPKNRADVLEKLITIDPLKSNYYQDQRSSLLIKNAISNSLSSNSICLTQMNLTNLYHLNELMHIKCLDLSNNNLKRINKSLNSLICLEILIMDSNQIYTIENGFKSVNLKILSLSNNRLKSLSVLNNLKDCHHLQELILNGNPISSLINDGKTVDLLNVKLITGPYDLPSFDKFNSKIIHKTI